MSESAVLIMLGIVSVCLLAITVVFIWTAVECRGTLRRFNEMLPDAGETFRETRLSLRQVRRVMARAGAVTRHVEAVVNEACDVAAETLDQVVRLKGQAEHFMLGRFGNGAGSGPRRRGPTGRSGSRRHR